MWFWKLRVGHYLVLKTAFRKFFNCVLSWQNYRKDKLNCTSWNCCFENHAIFYHWDSQTFSYREPHYVGYVPPYCPYLSFFFPLLHWLYYRTLKYIIHHFCSTGMDDNILSILLIWPFPSIANWKRKLGLFRLPYIQENILSSSHFSQVHTQAANLSSHLCCPSHSASACLSTHAGEHLLSCCVDIPHVISQLSVDF